MDSKPAGGSPTQAEKAATFRALHAGPAAFVLPNPWDAVSARLLASLGFPALATSSAASAAALGRRDGELAREDALAHARTIVGATDLPVSADLENGFGDAPEAVAETVRLAAASGLAGCSIEDASRANGRAVYDRIAAAERIAAAAEAAHALPFPFTLTARAENFVRGHPDLEDTIGRLQAFERAGADVLFAPGLPDLEAVARICASVSRPVNFMVGIGGQSFSVAELAAAGVRRISLATSLFRVAMYALLAAGREIRDSGTFTFVDDLPATSDLYDHLRAR